MLPIMRVKDVAKSPVVTVDSDATVTEAARLMAEKNISGVIVTERNRPVGVVTERDILKKVAAAAASPSSVRVGDIMSQPLIR